MMFAKFICIMVIILSISIPLRCLAEDIAAEKSFDSAIAESVYIPNAEKEFNKIFDKYYKNTYTYDYTFYINPLKWSLMTHKSKVILYIKCVFYNMAKEKEEGRNPILVISERRIKIRSSIDGTILVVYNPKMGKPLLFADEFCNSISENLLFTKLYYKFKPRNQVDILIAYTNKAKSKLEDNKYSYKPFSVNRSYKVVINRTGEIEKLVLVSPPWIDKVDDYAADLIKATAPFEPIPKEYKKIL